jgi:hypothetical protein
MVAFGCQTDKAVHKREVALSIPLTIESRPMGAKEVARPTPASDAGMSLRDLVRRVQNYEPFPLSALEAVAAVRRHLSDFEFAAMVAARELGATWSEVAEALGISRQGAQVKFAKQRSEKAR